MKKIFIDGREVTTWLLIDERLSDLKGISLLTIDEDKRKDPFERKRLINESDITFLCLPDDAARESVSLCENPDTVIIDTSTAHRTDPRFAYGFPELSRAHRDAVLRSKRIAVPGCHATGFAALVYPLVTMGILPPDYPLTCFSITGYTGGGKKMIAEYESDTRSSEYDAPRLYGLSLSHKHIPEMMYICGLKRKSVFCPIVADFPRGMAVSVPLNRDMLTRQLKGREILDKLSDYYQEGSVKVIPFMGEGVLQNGFLPSNKLAGENTLEIFVGGSDEQIMLTSVLDNLGKGASGAAVELLQLIVNSEQ